MSFELVVLLRESHRMADELAMWNDAANIALILVVVPVIRPWKLMHG